MAGRMVRFTPNGLSVSERQRAISSVSFSGVGWVSAVMKPRPPALATAATSSARPTHCMPPWTMGCSMPNISVNRVLSAMVVPPNVCLDDTEPLDAPARKRRVGMDRRGGDFDYDAKGAGYAG